MLPFDLVRRACGRLSQQLWSLRRGFAEWQPVPRADHLIAAKITLHLCMRSYARISIWLGRNVVGYTMANLFSWIAGILRKLLSIGEETINQKIESRQKSKNVQIAKVGGDASIRID